MKITTGDVFRGTHANLLNELGLRTKSGEKFEQYYKGTYELDRDTYIWIISIDGEERSGWINSWVDTDTIIERNTERCYHPIGLTHKYRAVFQKDRSPLGNTFTFMGYFKLQPESTNEKRILKKINGEFELS